MTDEKLLNIWNSIFPDKKFDDYDELISNLDNLRKESIKDERYQFIYAMVCLIEEIDDVKLEFRLLVEDISQSMENISESTEDL